MSLSCVSARVRRVSALGCHLHERGRGGPPFSGRGADDLQRILCVPRMSRGDEPRIRQRRLSNAILYFLLLLVGAGITSRITSSGAPKECAVSVHLDVSAALGCMGGGRHEPLRCHVYWRIHRTAPRFRTWLPPS